MSFIAVGEENKTREGIAVSGIADAVEHGMSKRQHPV